jgi:hypothetical protein
LIYILALPVALEAPYILSLWLKEVPQYTTLFLWVTIGYVLLKAFANPIVRGVHATGKIKFLNFTSGIFSVSVTLPILYILYRLGFPFWVMFIITIVRCIGCNILEVVSLHRNIHFSYWDYFKKVYLKSFMVALVSAIIPVILVIMLPSNFGRLVLVTAVSLTATMSAVYYLGLDKATQVKVVSFIKRKIKRNKD